MSIMLIERKFKLLYIAVEANNVKYKKKVIGSIIILVIFTAFIVTGYFMSKTPKQESSNDIFVQSQTTESKNFKELTVYINGEVKNPGVYKVRDGNRIGDLVKLAGGFSQNAETSKLNLAKKLKDEDYVYVEGKSSSSNASTSTQGGTISAEDKVNINTASEEELKTVPGIGDVTAQKIIDYREKNGDFSSIEDLKKIDRIGTKTLDKMKDKIDVR